MALLLEFTKVYYPEDEYDDILRHVYESRGMIEF